MLGPNPTEGAEPTQEELLLGEILRDPRRGDKFYERANEMLIMVVARSGAKVRLVNQINEDYSMFTWDLTTFQE